VTASRPFSDSARQYIAAYNEPDRAKTSELLSLSLSPGGRYISENQELSFDGILEMASGFHEVAEMRIEGEIRVHGRYATFRWSFTEFDTGEITTGIDFCEFAEDGLIDKVVVFFD